jgi:hypothetical protein
MRPSSIAVGLTLTLLSGWPASSAAAGTQVEIDRIVSRVQGRIVTLSDIRQARLLKLVDDVSSDDAVRRALENRWLMLGDLARATPVAVPDEDEIASRRDTWRAALGSDADAIVQRGGMSDAEITAWLRDDLRLRAFVERQFGKLTDNDRQRAMNDWIARLRQRARLAD